MKQNYEVTFTAFSTVLVIGARDEKEAREFARNEISTSDWEITEEEATIVPSDKLEAARRHATAVAEDEDGE